MMNDTLNDAQTKLDDAERDRQIVAGYKRLPSNNARLRWLGDCSATEARAIYAAPIAKMDGFSRGLAERRLLELADRAKAQIVAAAISARAK